MDLLFENAALLSGDDGETLLSGSVEEIDVTMTQSEQRLAKLLSDQKYEHAPSN
jgi:hypothetical protein